MTTNSKDQTITALQGSKEPMQILFIGSNLPHCKQTVARALFLAYKFKL